MRKLIGTCLALIALMLSAASYAQPAEKRIALVIGNAAYPAGALATTANDAGLIAQTLQAAGFDVVGARDLDLDSLRRAFHDFLDKAQSSGPDTVAYIYFGGYGLQLEGENYLVPVDAKVAHDTDIPLEALRLSDYTRPLASLHLKSAIVVLDAARANPFAKSDQPIAGGLALVGPEPGMLIAFNAAPGTIAPESQGAYGPFAQSLAEMMREGGLPLTEVFDRVRLRVNDLTKGAEVPWSTAKGDMQFVFFERGPDAPPPAASADQTAAIRTAPIRDLGAQQGYVAALDRDTLPGYGDFLAAYPDDPMAKRVRAIVAARREAIIWRSSRLQDTPPAYWSYLRRYPHGPHAWDARRRLAYLAAEFEPPPSFPVMSYDVPPPPPDELAYVDRPVLAFDDPVYAFAPPPPPPLFWLPPPPVDFYELPPPPPPIGIFILPIPIYRPVPVWVRAPAYVAPPPNNIIFVNVHNTVVINNTTNSATITTRSGQTHTITGQPAFATQPSGGRAAGMQPGATAPATIGPALPPSVARKAVALHAQPSSPGNALPGAHNGALTVPGQTTAPANHTLGAPLPGSPGHPLPPTPFHGATPGSPAATLTPPTGAKAPSGPTSTNPTLNVPPNRTNPTARFPDARVHAPTAALPPTPVAPSTPTIVRPTGPNLRRDTNQSPPTFNRPTGPPPNVIRPSTSPTFAARPPAPPPHIVRPPSPPPVVSRPPPPPPPHIVARPPPPPPVARAAPPPPPAAKPAPPAKAACGGPGHPCPK